MHPRTNRLVAAIAGAWACAGGWAQAHEDPSSDPALTGPSVEERIQVMDTPTLSREPVKPDGSEVGAVRAPLREGSFLSARRGRLAQRAEGWTFYFDADATGRSDPPVRMEPCSTLSAMLRLVESRRETTTFFMSGEVFAHDGMNYVLPTHFTVAAAPAKAPEGEGPHADVDPPAGVGAEPSAADLIAGVERATSARRVAPVGGAAEGGAGIVREGEFFNLRRGRVSPESSGTWRIVFDSGVESGRDDPPMTLMPCHTLTRLEALARDSEDGVTVTISGRVYVFEGRNYLLPTLFFVDYASASAELRSAR